MVKIGELLLKFPRKKKIPATEYQQTGDTPIIDQSKDSWIAGYTDLIEARHEDPLPITVFGDHTRTVKYVDFPFASGADGTQLLFPNSKEIDPIYFYYAIKNVDLSNYFYARHFKFLKEQEIPIPKLSSQRKIAQFLRRYDELIDNNINQTKLLENYARLIYEEWFVSLQFPGMEQAKIEDSIPKGWKAVLLGAICDEIRVSVSPESLQPDTPYIGLEHMPRRSISLSEWGISDSVTSTKHAFIQGDILFGKIRPYFHKVGVAFIDGVASSDAIVIRPISESLHSLVLMTVSSDRFVAEASQTMKEGSKMPRADWKLMMKYPIALPPQALLEEFSNTITPIVQQLRTLALLNNKLRAARDLLLPRLMSGEVSV